MSLVTNEKRFPPRRYKTVAELALPENAHLREVDVDAILSVHEKVHTSVEGSKIVEFYTGKSVFLTGGTGYIGKLVTEKLLRTCKEIKTVYLLIRPKKGKSVDERLDITFDNAVFSELKKADPEFRNKIVPILGDTSLPNLGISNAEREKLIDNVNVIIHGAACVMFDEPLRKAAKIHVSGTKEIMNLAQECKKLVSLVHISTAYSHCLKLELKEELYDPPYETEPFLKMIEDISDEDVERNKKEILSGWPNTYSLTKAIAEHTVQSMAKDIPAAIFRPSIVLSTFKEPIQSYIDNLYGPLGMMFFISLGILRTSYMDLDKTTDLVPGDFVANGIIAASYQNQFNKKGKVEVYHSVSSPQNPIRSKDFQDLCFHYGQQTPSIFTIWFYVHVTTTYKYVFYMYELFLQWIPGLIIESILYFTKSKRRLLSVYKKIHKHSMVTSYFTLREWKFHNDNIQKLWNGLCEKDKELFEFSFEPESFDWNSYVSILGLGIRQFLIKDKIETLPAAKKRFIWFYYIHIGFKIVCLLIALKVLMVIFNATINCVF